MNLAPLLSSLPSTGGPSPVVLVIGLLLALLGVVVIGVTTWRNDAR